MALEKLTIIAFSDETFTTEKGRMTVNINPHQYSQSFQICYNAKQSQGSSGPSPDFNKMKSATVNFDLIFDATGAGPQPAQGSNSSFETGVTAQIDSFRKLVLDFDGAIHSPKFVKLSWGSLLFKCRLQSLNFSYTLFKPDGTPLRAKATTTFIGFTDEDELAKRARKSSPDLSHLVKVEAGDTLPQLCWRIYGSSLHYRRVAEINGLTSFRHLQPGTQLLFPPLESAAR